MIPYVFKVGMIIEMIIMVLSIIIASNSDDAFEALVYSYNIMNVLFFAICLIAMITLVLAGVW